MVLKTKVVTLQIILLLQFFSVKAEHLMTKESNDEISSKQERVASLFSVVTFPNSACVTKSDTSMRGTCYTTTECTNKGGIADGKCASGFGICCMFTISDCSSTISQNCTYIQNPGYPSSFSGVNIVCSYNVAPVQDDICQLRLDFNNFVSAISTATPFLCIDSFVATSPTGTVSNTICGINTNQHMYVETGSSKTPTNLAFTIGAGLLTRTWKIKVSQIECWSTSKAPGGCTQYFTGPAGNVMTYNFAGAQMLTSQQYTNCFRQELGYCGIDYVPSSVTTPNSFQLGVIASNTGAGCFNNPAAVMIVGDQNGAILFCGTNLVFVVGNVVNNSVRQRLLPFALSVISTNNQPISTGFNIVYSQVPCY